MLTALAILTCLGAGTIGGVFYGFSTSVMKALGDVPPAQGALAMQRINVVVLNPMFLGVFMGTALLGGACIVVAMMRWGDAQSAWLVAAGLLYVLGCFGVTMACNVPRNDRLARMDAASPEAQAYWSVYVQEWTWWNHVRTAASLAAAACCTAALVAAP